MHLLNHRNLNKKEVLILIEYRKNFLLSRRKKIKAENITCDQLTGEEFEDDAEGHHMTRKKDDPSKALDPSNIIVVKSKTHDAIHKAEANSPETLKELAKEKGWNEENIK